MRFAFALAIRLAALGLLAGCGQASTVTTTLTPDMAQPCMGDGCCKVASDCAGMASCCGGRCTDVQGDSNNCGACGRVCPGGELCCAGACIEPVGNPEHCGACDVKCGAVAHSMSACIGLACTTTSCDPGWADCNGAVKDGCEVQTDSNVNNCGACNKVCSIAHATSKCVAATCAIETCLYPWMDCDKSAANGCEQSVLEDVMNCGGCGAVCTTPNATAGCHQGQCTVTACTSGYADCNGKVSDGCEVQTDTDLANCGACGTACGSNNATPSCAAGKCKLTCNAGYGDCDMQAANGCERDLRSDVNNCLVCGNACKLNHATPACVNSRCSVGVCDGGWSDCNKIDSDGCEQSTGSDPQNCGACGVVCSSSHISKPTCTNSLCDGQCDAGFGDCNGNKQSDGCEVDLSSDAKNCGACGMACQNGQTCSNSQCITPYFPGSALVTQPQGAQINQWIGTPNQQWRLCFLRSRDGGSSYTMHNKCDGLGPSVVVSKLSTGVTIGGYAPQSWQNCSCFYGDNSAFLFSLTNNFKHTPFNGNYQYGRSDYGPTFGGGHDWYNDSGLNTGYCNMGSTYNCRVGGNNSQQCYNDFCGAYQGWSTVEMEVWVH